MLTQANSSCCHTVYALYGYATPSVYTQHLITLIAYLFHHIITWMVNTTIPLPKQDIQLLLEQSYKQNIIAMIISQHMVTYSTYLNSYCLSYFMNICSEFVLTSSKFLNQVKYKIIIIILLLLF